MRYKYLRPVERGRREIATIVATVRVNAAIPGQQCIQYRMSQWGDLKGRYSVPGDVGRWVSDEDGHVPKLQQYSQFAGVYSEGRRKEGRKEMKNRDKENSSSKDTCYKGSASVLYS